MALYNTHRPLILDDVLGQTAAVTSIKNAFLSGRLFLSRTYLFYGTRGSGKTTVARIIARLINCESPNGGNPCNSCSNCRAILEGRTTDFTELDAASNRGVDAIDSLTEAMQFKPVKLKYKTYIIDEVHQLSSTAKDSLLKTLEEPPKHVLIILCTTEQDDIPDTIKSRCQTWKFRDATIDDIRLMLQSILDKEGIPYDSGGLLMVAKEAHGSFRDALSIAEAVCSYSNAVTESQVSAMLDIPARETVKHAASAVCKGDVLKAVEIVRSLENKGADIDRFLEFTGRLIIDAGKQLLITGKPSVYGLSPQNMVNVGATILKGRLKFKDSEGQIMGDVVLIDAANEAAGLMEV